MICVLTKILTRIALYLCLTNNKEEEILGATTDNKHNFNNNIKRSVEKLARK